MRNRIFRVAGGALLAMASALGASRTGAADTPDAIVLNDRPMAAIGLPATELRILSYNVEGLPWPVARGRADAAAAIADTLHRMRAQGRQPQIVALQEAFGAAAKRIGRDAGYSYAAYGPASGLAGTPAVSQQDRDFVAAASAWHGETLGKHADSGLAIFSDYPILWVKRIAFPAYACAGWDCLANKGVLAVAVRMPGSDKPVVVFDTHLNSRNAAKVDKARADYAYRRQVDTLGAFIGDVAPSDARVVLTGDFNVGHDGDRTAYVNEHVMTDGRFRLAAIELDCGHACRTVGTVDPQAQATLRTGKIVVAFRADDAALTPLGDTVSFGRAPDGHMLSDHVGLATGFDIGNGPADRTQIASAVQVANNR